MENILKNNKLIAEFMGADFGACGDNIFIAFVNEIFSPTGSTTIDLSDLKYHTSWDWLMPVINKIFSLDEYINYKNYSSNIIISDGGIFINTVFIKNTYNDVVDFIKWYNENK